MRCIEGNIPDPGLLKEILRGADGIFHQAAIPLFHDQSGTQ
ncbi:MAG: hypothetical protein WC502_10810 [Methanolinea sp.]